LGKYRTVFGAHPCPKISANSQEIAYHVRSSEVIENKGSENPDKIEVGPTPKCCPK
jgi:hypothetical protein